MSARTRHPTAEDLSAHVDGDLDVGRDTTPHLAECVACRERVEELRALKRAVGRAVGAFGEAPGRLHAALGVRTDEPRPPRRVRVGVASVVVVAVAAAAAALLVFRARQAPVLLPSALRDEVALDHLHYAPMSNPAQIASDDPGVVAAALESRLGRVVAVPTWEAATLIGGRACRIHDDLVPLVLYERAGHRISFFELRNLLVDHPGCDRGEGGLQVCARSSPRGGALVAVADLPPHELQRLLQVAGGGS